MVSREGVCLYVRRVQVGLGVVPGLGEGSKRSH